VSRPSAPIVPAATAALGALAMSAALAFAVRSTGFDHVSDDDFARVVIAQQFAVQPRLDPSGTSWLPVPFYALGAALRLGERSLESARAWSVVLNAVACGTLGGCTAWVARSATVGAATVLLCLALPWSVWLSASTVPEVPVAAAVAASAVFLGTKRGGVPASVLLLLASLSRYEAWPACAFVSALCIFRGARAVRTSQSPSPQFLAASVAAAGPLAWIAWNAYFHGEPFHFFARVARYRAEHGPATSLAVAVANILVSLWRLAPWTCAAAIALSLVGLTPWFRLPPASPPASSPDDPRTCLRRGVKVALGMAAATVVFLMIGAVRNGAPTHHPERALLSVAWLLSSVVVWTCAIRWPMRRTWVTVVALLSALVSIRHWTPHPAASEAERRDSQVARGRLHRQAGHGALRVVPCAHEHFALMAAYGAPERVQIALPDSGASSGPGALRNVSATREPPTARDCPRVEVLDATP
jgi:hypothetical protein